MMWLNSEAGYSEPAEVAFLEMCKLGWAKALSTGGIAVPQLRCWTSFEKNLDQMTSADPIHPIFFLSLLCMSNTRIVCNCTQYAAQCFQEILD